MLAISVLSLLCWAFLPDDVTTQSVTTQNGVTPPPTQNVSYPALSNRCMYCRKAEHIIDCLGVITCAAHEVCFIEKEMLPTGWPVINAGCRSRHTCNLKTCFGESMHGYQNRVNKRSTLSCHHCCEGEFCNLYGCPDSEDMMVLPSTRCLGCDAVKDPIFCDKMINCPYSQQCVAYGVFHAGGLRFELGCEEKTYCNAFNNNSKGKRDVNHHVGEIDLASTCCDTHLCNRNWPVVDQPLPKVISGFTCHHRTDRPLLSTLMGLSPTSLIPTSAASTPPTHTTSPTPGSASTTSPTPGSASTTSPTPGSASSTSPTPVSASTTSPTPGSASTTSPTPGSASSHMPTPSTQVSPATQATPGSSPTTTLEPFHTTSTPGTVSPTSNITIPSSENCKDRALETNCDFLNKTSQLCDTITLTSVYYCVKFCGFCTPLPSRPGLQGETTTAGVVSPPAPHTTNATPQDIPVLIGKRHGGDSIDDTNRRRRHPIH